MKILYVVLVTIFLLHILRYVEPFMPVYLLNLERCPGRYAYMAGQMMLYGIPFSRFDAYDGKSYEFTEEERRKLFGIMIKESFYIERHSKDERDQIFAKMKVSEPNYQKRINVMACALSHISAIMECRNTNDKYMCVLEDDGLLCPQLRQRMNETVQKLDAYDPDWHIVWLSGKELKTHKQIIFWNSGSHSIYRMDPPEYNGQGGGAYILSRKGINHYLNVYDEKGCSDGFDWFLLRQMDIHHGYGVYPCFVEIHNSIFPSSIGNKPAYLGDTPNL